MKISSKLVTSLVAGSIGGLAQAAPVTMSDTVTLGTLLNNQTTTVHYDATNLLASMGMTRADVLSGSLVVYGLSDALYQTSPDPYGAYFVSGSSQRAVGYSYTYYSPVYVNGYSYSCGWGGWSTCYYSGYTYYQAHTGYSYYVVTDYSETEQRNIEHRDTQDTMTVSVGGTTDSTVDSVVGQTVGAYGQPVYQSQNYNPYGSSYTYYSQERDVYDSVTGPLQLSMAFDALALQSLRDTGLIDINVGAGGQFSLQSIGFSLTAQGGNAVPEPASIVLSLAGIAALAATRRRKKAAGK